MMKNKKASAIPFHWLFVVIAGGAILFLFTMFIQTGKEASEGSLSVDLLLQFDALFSTVASPEKTDSIIPSHKDIFVEFSCKDTNGNIDSRFSTQGKASKNFDDVILFSHEKISGDSLFITSQMYNNPFSVSSLIFLTDPSVLYVVEGQSPADRAFVRSLVHENVTVITLGEKTEAGDIYPILTAVPLDEYERVVVLTLSTQTRSSASSELALSKKIVGKGDIYLYDIVLPDQKGDDIRVEGYDLVKDGATYIFQGEGSVLVSHKSLLRGVIYSESIGQFECVSSKLISRIALVSSMLVKRTELLKIKADEYNSYCVTRYTQAIDELEAIALNPLEISSHRATLREINTNLEYQSCPLIY